MLRGFIGRWLLACAWTGGLCLLSSSVVAQSNAEVDAESSAQSDAKKSIEVTELSLDNPLSRTPQEGETTIATIQIKGNRSVSKKKIRGKIDSRAGEPLDTLKLQRDVRNLTKLKGLFDVKVKTQPSPEPNSVVVIFEVFEFPKLEYIYFIGNAEISARTLTKKSELKVGDPLNIMAVEDARQKVLTFYNEKGFNKVQVDIKEGISRTDRGAIFLIDEGPQQRIWTVKFVGNSIVSGSRLKTQIESKPSRIKYATPLAGGYVDRRKIDEDVNRLTSYYRSLGYMVARIGRSMEFTDDDRWLNLTFVIDEGPRFKIRDILFEGNELFGDEQLEPLLNLKTGDYFDLSSMQTDMAALTDAYGALGFILADIKPSPRTLEKSPEIDLVYNIAAGNRYRVGRINVKIAGDNPHTQRTVALNRIDLRPGDIVDIRKIRDSERRLRASGLFLNDVQKGVKPKIVFKTSEQTENLAEGIGEKSFRGQSPDRTVSTHGEGPTR